MKRAETHSREVVPLVPFVLGPCEPGVRQLSSGRSCLLLRVRVLWLPNYHVLSFPDGEPTRLEEAELMSIALAEARARSQQITGSPEKFTLIYSGHSTRRRHGWHVHVIVVRNRWEKAWMYFVLAAKNFLQQLNLYRPNKKGRWKQPA